ncbi:MAG: arylamine N-acetyltransferase, partial [Nocardioidaceae bacterium]|nr:arylamine N-acetyltransferase [Nocardioidaceae bacterium]
MDAALSAYLRRLGFSSAPAPTLDTLVALHRAHLATIPYENLGIMLGSPPSADVTDTVERIAATGRAGYCFHHNGAFE